MRVYARGAWRDVIRGSVYATGAWRTIKRAIAYEDGAWREVLSFVPDLTATVSPPAASGTVNSSGVATTNTVTATPSGGEAPYTYAWTRLGGGSGTANSPASARTSFSRFVEFNEVANEQFRCTITDNAGTQVTVDLDVTFSSLGIGEEGFE